VIVLTRLEEAIGQLLSWALLLVVLLQVVDRFLFSGGLQLAWTEEIARVLLVWYVFWGAALVEAEHSHIRVDLFERWLSARARAIVINGIAVAIAGLLVVLGTYAALYAVHEGDARLPATGLKRSVFVLAVVVSSALMLLHVVLRLLTKFRFSRTSSTAMGQ
jgi:TRAP-type C4-dicarboxylate transport system permease small subunit